MTRLISLHLASYLVSQRGLKLLVMSMSKMLIPSDVIDSVRERLVQQFLAKIQPLTKLSDLQARKSCLEMLKNRHILPVDGKLEFTGRLADLKDIVSNCSSDHPCAESDLELDLENPVNPDWSKTIRAAQHSLTYSWSSLCLKCTQMADKNPNVASKAW